jgi:hypothetical protein
MTGLLLPGAKVELVEALYGYDVGAQGEILQIGSDGSALVRFAATGHAMFVAREALRPVAAG